MYNRLDSLLRPDPNSEVLIRFNSGRREVPSRKPMVDPRNKDIETQRYNFRAINDYLSKTDYSYDLLGSYRQITTTEFEHVFKHLIDRAVPGYEYDKRLDANVKLVAEALRYPYVDQVVKSVPSLGTLHTAATMYTFLRFLVTVAEAMDAPRIEEDKDINHVQADREGLIGLLHDYTITRMHNDDPLVAQQKLQETFGKPGWR